MINRICKVTAQIALVGAVLFLVGCHSDMTGVLNPKGIITYQERQLLFDAVALMLIVVIPVIIMSFAFIYRYHQSHSGRDYRPNWSHNVLLESIWWGVPCVIIVILGIMTWHMSHKLDPYRPIDGVEGEPLKVQVVALPWKWLFVYPEQDIATVNYLELPKGRQVAFELTSDNVPMSAFFVPQIGSQIYTMARMKTQLHLVATETGTFKGLNSQYNGDGFSDMHFPVKVVEPAELDEWFQKVKSESKPLSEDKYNLLRQPSIAAPAQYFSGVTPNLFKRVIKSYKLSEHPSKLAATA
ncbi:MAG: ubiquinol oxidase subunit II [Legionellales bacterium]|nr:ubiquinol oxidase subunit II [Legionellales bacterium]|tara:strand:+ start:5872 stop:6762 length:891 start_codon:yes stop_codon:yes gene_type:complete